MPLKGLQKAIKNPLKGAFKNSCEGFEKASEIPFKVLKFLLKVSEIPFKGIFLKY
jgi:hypothetical protein